MIMEEELKEKWIDALMGPQYPQGHYRLRNSNSVEDKEFYCCLGVLCDLLQNVEKDSHQNREGFSYKDEFSEIELPGSLAEDLGISEEFHKRLQKFNDNGKTFQHISNWIEENL